MPGEDELQALADDIRERGQSQPAMPRRTSSLFHPRRVLQLGNGMWVRMDRATVSDLLTWSRQSRRNRSRTDLADNDVQDDIDQRIDAFRSHPGLEFLGDLERIIFVSVNDPDQPADNKARHPFDSRLQEAHLATRSCVARPTDTGYRGIYVHADGYPSNHLPLLLAAYQYRFTRDAESLSRYLVDTDAIGWDTLGDDLLDGAPAHFGVVLHPHPIGPSRPIVNVLSSDGGPARRMVFDESNAQDSQLKWAYVLRPLGVEVIALSQDTRGPVVGWDSDPLLSYSDEPRLWRPDAPIPLTGARPKAPGMTATQPPAAGPPSAQQPTANR